MMYQWLHSYPSILWSQCIRISDFLLYRKMHMDTDRLLNNEGVRWEMYLLRSKVNDTVCCSKSEGSSKLTTYIEHYPSIDVWRPYTAGSRLSVPIFLWDKLQNGKPGTAWANPLVMACIIVLVLQGWLQRDRLVTSQLNNEIFFCSLLLLIRSHSYTSK